ncbi:MAG: T9SS type A sorting domain-containing protein, partial [Candidatus Cloacimonetes bacterium]|nr:T9SS type A sorting domain-containing protein [Candidatus Cloacimonadota bacterium]
SYTLPKPAHVNIKIYNIKGQLVETLVDENKPAGYHTVGWNVLEKSRMSSGIYFYKFEANDKVLIKKMIILR